VNPRMLAVREGLARGRIEFRHNAGQAFSYVFFPTVALVVMYLLRDNTVSGTGFSIADRAVPGVLAMNIVFTAVMGLAITLITDRDDGTLLRAKATPNGVLGYLVGKVVSQAAMSVLTLLIVLIPAGFLFSGLQLDTASSWLTLAWVLTLGLLATLPLGAILGSLFTNARNLRYVTLLLMMLVGVSGVFSGVASQPTWMVLIALWFPLYWLSLGMRSAMLPGELASSEFGQSWQHLETVSVLGAWAFIGLAVAPAVLRRMARREPGSRSSGRARRPRSLAH
jgi:ABC-2 type transport system permease protein